MLIRLHTHCYYLFYFVGELLSHFFGIYWNSNMIFQFGLGTTMCIWSLPMQKLIYENTKCPNIGFRSINIMNETFRRHINGRSNVDIFKILSNLFINYLVNFAKPKSAIFALPLCRKTLATFKSRCITFFCAKYKSPLKISLIIG